MPRSVAALTALVALSACADGIPDIDTAPGEVELERFVAASGFPERDLKRIGAATMAAHRRHDRLPDGETAG